MLNCSVTRNAENKITKVVSQTGQESQLFINIAKHPLANSTEDAFNIYQNIFSKELQETPEENIRLTHSVNGQQYSSYGQALKTSQEGQKIEIGFATADNFHPIITTVKNTDKSNEVGFVQSGILNGLIAAEKRRVGNDYFLQSTGESELKQAVTMEMVYADARAHLGSKSLVKSSNTFTLNKTLGFTTVYEKSGEQKIISQEELDSLSFEQLKERFDYAEELLAEREWTANRPAYRENALETEQPQQLRTEEDLQSRLLDLLNKLGVSVVPISNYLINYKIKNGVNPSATALSDIANRVVSYAEGKISLQDLTEETAHFLVESFPRERSENLLRNIDKSEEYKEFAQAYREIYRDEVPSEDLEEAVRREVLGKIVANSIASGFSAGERSETQRNFIENALYLVREFFENIANYFKSSYRAELDGYLQDIDNIVQSGELSSMVDVGNFGNSRFRFYNVSGVNKTENDQLRNSLKKTIDYLQTQEANLRRAGGNFSRVNRNTLDRVEKELDGVLKQHSVRSIITMVDESTQHIKAAIKDSQSKNKKYLLSAEENLVFTNLDSFLAPAIADIKALIDKDLKGKEWKAISDNIGEVLASVNSLSAEKRIATNQTVEKLIDSVTVERGQSEYSRESMRKWMLRAEKDQSVIQATFGTLISSSDAMLQLLGLTIGKINGKSHRGYQSSLKDLQTIMDKNGISAQQMSELFFDDSNRYILSEWDQSKFEDKLNENFVQAFKQITNSELSDEDILKNWQNNKLNWTTEQQEDVFNLKKELDAPEQEKRMNAQYYADYEKRLNDNNISQDTRRELSNYIADIQTIKNKAISADGKLNITLLNAQDRQALQKLERRRSQLKSYIGTNGELKEGLRFKRQGGTVYLEEGKPVIEAAVSEDKLSPGGRVALDLNRLDESFEKTNEKGELEMPQSFIEGIRDLENYGREEQLAYLDLNSFIGFKSEYYDGQNKANTIQNKLQTAKEEQLENESEINQLIEDITTYNFKIRGIIKNYTKKNSPSETDFANMPILAQSNVKTYQEQLETFYAKAREYTKNITDEEVENESKGTTSINESYTKLLRDLDLELLPTDTAVESMFKIKGILDLARQHMTSENAKLVQKAQYAIDDFLDGKRKNLPKSVEKALAGMGINASQLQNEEVYAQFLKSYSDSRLLPYFKRYTPESYTRFREDLQNPEKNVADIIENLNDYEFVDVRPNFSFYDVDESQVNPNYVKNSGTGFSQPNGQKYENKKFKNLFGKVTRDSQSGEYLTSEKNQRQFEVYKKMIEFRKGQIGRMDMGSSYNIYQRPQLRAQTVEKVVNLVKGASVQKVRDAIEDLATFTQDDQVKGDARLGTAGNTIPKKFVQKLSNQSDITTDLFVGLALTERESHLYAARNEYFADVMAIKDKFLTREVNGNKPATATNSYKMMQSAINFSIMGVSEEVTLPFKTAIGEIDLAKVVNQFGSLIRFKGLGGSVIIPMTAALTQKSQQLIERAVGQYIDNRTYKLASADLKDDLSAGMKEAGQIDTKAPLNVIGQHFQCFDLDNTIDNSKYGFLTRVAPRMSMFLYAATNYGLYGANLYSTLYDFRVVNGKVYKSSDYYRQQVLQGKSLKEAKTEWIKNENSAIKKFITIQGRQVVFDKEKIGNLLNLQGEKLDTEIERINSDIRIQVKNLNVRTDSALATEDRTLAQRTFLLKLAMSFRGFIVPLTENRFKQFSYNAQTRMAEAGSYSETYRYLGAVVKEAKQNGGKILQAFRDEYNGNYGQKQIELKKLEDLQRPLTLEEETNKKQLQLDIEETYERAQVRRQGLRRIGIDALFMNSVMLLSLLARAYGDEPDDPWALQMTNLLTYRLATEVYQSNFGIVQNYTQILDNPINAIDSAKSIGDFMNFFSEDDKKQQSIANKLLPFASGIEQMSNPLKAYETKRYFAEVKGSTFNLVPAYLLFPDEDDKPE